MMPGQLAWYHGENYILILYCIKTIFYGDYDENFSDHIPESWVYIISWNRPIK
jgi:hypothetical protein